MWGLGWVGGMLADPLVVDARDQKSGPTLAYHLDSPLAESPPQIASGMPPPLPRPTKILAGEMRAGIRSKEQVRRKSSLTRAMDGFRGKASGDWKPGLPVLGAEVIL